MNQLTGINAVCYTLLHHFQVELKSCWNNKKPDKDNIEKCFLACHKYWEKIKEQITLLGFQNKPEEIYFFKHIKPALTNYIEFYSLLYQADMFCPENKNSQLQFWKREIEKLKNFRDKYKDFYTYYKSNKTANDEIYFTRTDKIEIDYPISKFYTEDSRSTTGYDHLLACFIAYDRYEIHANKKLKELGISQ